MGKRYFTVDEANRLVPRLQAAFGRVMQLRAQLKAVYRRLDARKLAPTDESFPVEIPGAPPEVVRDRATFKALALALREELAAVHETGCVIKDVEIGLVDWFAEQDGREILLCWRCGEKEVGFWHDLEAGYAGRRPVAELRAGAAGLRLLH